MTVKELISKLQLIENQDLDVVIISSSNRYDDAGKVFVSPPYEDDGDIIPELVCICDINNRYHEQEEGI